MSKKYDFSAAKQFIENINSVAILSKRRVFEKSKIRMEISCHFWSYFALVLSAILHYKSI
ncbi:hypothetical protein SD77_2965 [Bacillus badius]|uniref:Mobile element protein n=1 Tax=Bacillus badius TaxID=1455 RepID=A0ABR5APP8_BACBA|nr:hypothetical protein SD77_2965 [Bacillus badius]KIL74765.1 hypothetical protein SD78_1834 [Bacillus badius]